MKTISKTFALVALAATAFVTPALAQTLSIGPAGIRVLEDPPVLERGRDPGRRSFDRRDRDQDQSARRGNVSEREAVRIARGEGLREVENIRTSRSSYRIDGLDRRGDDIRVDVDRRSGEVIAVR